MEDAIVFRGTVTKEGRFAPDEPARYLVLLAKLKGKRIEVGVRKARLGRTYSANRFLFGWCYKLLSGFTGHTKDELHHAMKCKILGYDDGPLGPIPKGDTRTMSIEEFSEFVERVRSIAAEFGCPIPDPAEVA